MSKTIASALVHLIRASTCFMPKSRQVMTHGKVMELLEPVITVDCPNQTLRFSCPTARAAHDPDHLFDGEPETIRWIDSLPQNEVLWDIGANVGTYTIYAAAVRKMNVVAFEPNAATFSVLARNIEINRCDTLVSALPIALSDETKIDHLYMANSAAGHSMHAFGTSENAMGQIDNAIKQTVLGYSIDDFVKSFSIAKPDHIKIDVDSIEELIIKGGKNTISQYVKTILIEVIGDDLSERANILSARIESLGLKHVTSFTQEGDARNILFSRSTN
ncbi:FkbM family methyltransferase [uncultured Thalassospira sp.]|uniref:FkbM family methyltransferase n=1 Tax=uncultured Thalassospira sp. TaxID=404382 RepID=UPI0025941411|nr:FkbM family methyltransferase [uncultured Thalassospira sp.]